jgi:hypothetical protein
MGGRNGFVAGKGVNEKANRGFGRALFAGAFRGIRNAATIWLPLARGSSVRERCGAVIMPANEALTLSSLGAIEGYAERSDAFRSRCKPHCARNETPGSDIDRAWGAAG